MITRSDIKVFLPPIGEFCSNGEMVGQVLTGDGCWFTGGLTVYVFGDPANMSDPSKRLALRIHDEV